MNIHLLAISSRTPAWVDEGFKFYAKRLPRHCSLRLVEVPALSRKQGNVQRMQDDESQRLLSRVPKNCRIIALTETGQEVTTRSLADAMGAWMQDGRDTAMLIGGADGLSQYCLDRAELCWSLSPLTFPHTLVRVIVAEQLYRAWTVLSNHPYHRD